MRVPTWMLPMRATVTPFLGQSAYEPLYDTENPVTIRCRIEPKRDVYRDRDGVEVVTSAVLFTFPDAPIAAQDRVSALGAVYDVVTVENLPGPSGAIHHRECLLR